MCKIRDTIFLILAQKRATGNVLPFATSIEVAHRLKLGAWQVEEQVRRIEGIVVGRTINQEYYKSQDLQIMKGFQNAIKAHLDKMAAQDEAFAKKYADKCASEVDSIASCCKYITNEVRSKYRTGNSAVLTDAKVFGMAMHYYDENITPPESGTNCKVVMSKVELSPEDEEAIRREARASAEEKIRNDERARVRKEQEEAERKKKAAEAAAAKRAEAAKKKREEVERKRKEWEEADLLFKFDEE